MILRRDRGRNGGEGRDRGRKGGEVRDKEERGEYHGEKLDERN